MATSSIHCTLNLCFCLFLPPFFSLPLSLSLSLSTSLSLSLSLSPSLLLGGVKKPFLCRQQTITHARRKKGISIWWWMAFSNPWELELMFVWLNYQLSWEKLRTFWVMNMSEFQTCFEFWTCWVLNGLLNFEHVLEFWMCLLALPLLVTYFKINKVARWNGEGWTLSFWMTNTQATTVHSEGVHSKVLKK